MNEESDDPRSVAVALCTHNSVRYLAPQLESIGDNAAYLSEVVVSDDASSDATVDMVREFAARMARSLSVRVIATESVGGTVPNFERALAACTADYVALADHDDVWTADRIPRGLAPLGPLVSATPPAISFSDARIVDGNGAPTGATLLASMRLTRRERRRIARGDALRVFVRRNVVTGATAIINRPLIGVGLPVEKGWVHDEWFAILAAALGEVHLVDAPLIDYRIHGANQIGVPPPGPVARLRRMLAARESRYERFADRFARLLERLSALDAPEPALALVREKVAFERARARYPRRRVGRVLPIARQAVAGRYRRLSSQGDLDVVRDLLQPA